ncbi:MAG: cyclic nucleotide-binding domain-containing protein [Microscillaceae bacterium]|jgi:serine phosphatase RsbU (regulator of sigma subunit)|nr:cyclic nucleotide-binding domain-containing protein [Microscillaceae bacterium]
MKAEPLGTIQERLNVLKNVSIFARTEDYILLKIAEALDEISIEADELLFAKDDEGNTMYVILSGSVKIHDGDYTFAKLGHGQVFGEYALLDTEERSASVTALEKTILLVLDQETFYGIMVNHVQILQGILRVLVGRARQTNKLQEELAREKKRIEEQSEEIKQQNEEILTQNEEIIQQQQQIAAQNDLLKEKNMLITSSINYAHHIQSALLPELNDLRKFMPESFVFFQPKDIVSGDFYWFYPLSDYRFMLVCADCTGHGVPGAFMSFLGMTYFRQIVEFQGITEVTEILNLLNQNIYIALKQEFKPTKDGMDLAVCLIDKQQQTIEFAGAKNGIFFIEPHNPSTIQIIKADNAAIGGYSSNKNFHKHIIHYQANTTFYLTSDGYRDQFGFENDEKFLMKRFKQLLLDIHAKPMDEQFKILADTHFAWRGNAVQTDDILVIGFRL